MISNELISRTRLVLKPQPSQQLTMHGDERDNVCLDYGPILQRAFENLIILHVYHLLGETSPSGKRSTTNTPPPPNSSPITNHSLHLQPHVPNPPITLRYEDLEHHLQISFPRSWVANDPRSRSSLQNVRPTKRTAYLTSEPVWLRCNGRFRSQTAVRS